MERNQYLIESFNRIEESRGQARHQTLERFVKDNFDSQHKDGFISSIEACLLANEGGLKNKYAETFNKTLNNILGLKKKDGMYLEAQVLNKEERELVEETFAQSVATATGGVVLAGQLRTNVSNLIDKYFYNNSILNAVTVYPADENTETVTDLVNERTASSSDELSGDLYEDNTTIADTITPTIRISETWELSLKLNEVMNPVNAATNLGRMMRAVKNRIEAMIIGTTATPSNGALEFYSIMNSQTSLAQNRGSLAVTLPIAAGAKPVNHIDAINLILGELPIFSPEEASQFSIVANWKTCVKLMRVMDSNNQYYYDYEAKVFRNLLTGAELRVVNSASLPDDVVGVWNLSSYILKLSRGFTVQSRISSLRLNTMEISIDNYGDGTLSMGYKAIPSKNGFRHFTLKSDYSV